MKIENININKIKMNPSNPRTIKDDKFNKLVKSIQEFPEMLKIRPIVVNDDLIVLGGNMRLNACKDAGLKEVPIIKASELTEEQQKEFIIKDNVGYGEWDYNMLFNDFDADLLNDWGLDLPDFVSPDKFGESFSLKDGDKEPFQQITFTLADEQAELLKKCLEKAKSDKHIETFGNENSNGNALYKVVKEWAELKKL